MKLLVGIGTTCRCSYQSNPVFVSISMICQKSVLFFVTNNNQMIIITNTITPIIGVIPCFTFSQKRVTMTIVKNIFVRAFCNLSIMNIWIHNNILRMIIIFRGNLIVHSNQGKTTFCRWSTPPLIWLISKWTVRLCCERILSWIRSWWI